MTTSTDLGDIQLTEYLGWGTTCVRVAGELLDWQRVEGTVYWFLPPGASEAVDCREALRSGDVMLTLFDRLQRSSMDAIQIGCTGPVSVELKSPGWGATGYGKTLPEALCNAAHAALLNERFHL